MEVLTKLKGDGGIDFKFLLCDLTVLVRGIIIYLFEILD